MLVRLALVLTTEAGDRMVTGEVVGLVVEKDREDTKLPDDHLLSLRVAAGLDS